MSEFDQVANTAVQVENRPEVCGLYQSDKLSVQCTMALGEITFQIFAADLGASRVLGPVVQQVFGEYEITEAGHGWYVFAPVSMLVDHKAKARELLRTFLDKAPKQCLGDPEAYKQAARRRAAGIRARNRSEQASRDSNAQVRLPQSTQEKMEVFKTFVSND
jgi:hypothetical protein